MKVVDGSYTNLTLEKAKALKALGYEMWVQCLWTGAEAPSTRVTNLRNAQQAGLLIAGYISIAAGHSGNWHMAKGCSGVPTDLWDQLLFVAVDVELDGIPNSAIRQAVDLYDKIKVIYTSYNAWVSKQGNPQDFTDCLLWNAYWDSDSDIDFPSLPYGGWTVDQVLGEQYTGGTNIAGVYVDLNEFNRNLLLGEDQMATSKEIRALQLLEAAALNDNMVLLRNLLVYFGVLPLGTSALKDKIIEEK